MHKIVVEDDEGCIDSVFFDIVEPDEILLTATSQDVSCVGLSDGQLMASATGGVGDIDFLWTTIPTTFDAVAMNQGAGSLYGTGYR